MTDIIKAIVDTPIPTMLVVAGILFLLLSVADKVSAHLTIQDSRKKQALLLGILLLAGGVGLSLQPRGEADRAALAEATAAAPPEAATAATPAATVAAPAATPAVAPEPINWDAMSWEVMKAEHRGHWALLGWTAESWENGAAPASNDKPFSALSAAEQSAVTALGMTAAQWDSR